ncbi:hypothetical protein [Micromonospora sp. NPDC005087]
MTIGKQQAGHRCTSVDESATKQIAARLVLPPRTVSTHLYKAFSPSWA